MDARSCFVLAQHGFGICFLLLGAVPLVSAQDLSAQCNINIPPLVDDTQQTPWYDNPLSIESSRIEAFQDGFILYEGDVEAQQGIRTFSANQASLNKHSGELNAFGNIHFSDGRITIYRGQHLKALQQDDYLQLDDSIYQLHGYPGRGHARKTTYSKQGLSLIDASFTTCPVEFPFWQLKAKEINVKKGQVFGEAWHASLWIKDKPVFYFPYFNFPVQNKRQSGLLYPKYTQSTLNGYEIRAPFYLNIADNMDATIEPHWIEKRGLMQHLEYRYLLNPQDSGHFYGEYIGQDQLFQHKKRWLFHWEHQATLGETPLKTDINLTRVAPKDYNYFNDFEPDVGTLNKNSLEQAVTLTWLEQNWDATLDIRTYQTLLPEALTPHMLLPRLSYQHIWQNSFFSTHLRTELTHFEHQSDRKPAYSGTRLHIEPEFYIPLFIKPAWSIDARLNLLYTYYTQKIPSNLDVEYRELGFTHLQEHVERFIPRLELNHRWFLTRTLSFRNNTFQQTLEPRLSYIYVPYRQQDHIGIYDSTRLPQDYYSLFYGRRFAGLDRVSDANKIIFGVTTSLFSPAKSKETLRIGIAQAFNIDSPRVTLFPSQDPIQNKRSFLSLEADAYITHDLTGHLGWQYDTDAKQLQALNAYIELQQDTTQMQLSYRFVDQDAFSDLDKSAPQEDIKQVGFLIDTSIHAQIRAIGAYYLDMNTLDPIERKLGLRYDSCCWSASFIMAWQKTPDNVLLQPKFNQSFGLELELKGLGDLGIKEKDFNLDTTLLPYTRSFNL